MMPYQLPRSVLPHACLLLLLLGHVGCIFSPQLEEGHYYCNQQEDCPSGMLCLLEQNRCRSTSQDGGLPNACPNEGAQEPCYSGTLGTQGTGECKAGIRTCQSGQWTACQGEITPQSDDPCNGKDDNCNGIIDEKCPCQEQATRKCYTGPFETQDRGACKAGSQTCQNGQWGPCVGEVTPEPETCDGLDNDCDGKTDQDVPPQRCYTGPPPTLGRGICNAGERFCRDGKWTECQGEILPAKENCNNNLDDDCNGKTDDC